MKIFKVRNTLIVKFDNGSVYRNDRNADELYNQIENLEEEEAKLLLFGESDINELSVENSKYLEPRGNCVLIPSISNVSLPKDLVSKILAEEAKGEEGNVQKYLNFWKLVSMNPDDNVRANIYWFINRWDVEIMPSGLLKAYRNVKVKEEGKINTFYARKIINSYLEIKYLKGDNPANYTVNRFTNEHGQVIKYELDYYNGENPALDELYDMVVNKGLDTDTYTDVHSGTFTIKLGQAVRMPREECDADQEASCSAGLHLGGKAWLQQGYFGDVGLECLVNPAHIVAVPTLDHYGKLRCCEYFPVSLIEWDKEGNIVDHSYTTDFEVDVLEQSLFHGTINNEDHNKFNVFLKPQSREEIYNEFIKSLN
jgi:hypothetical protein